MRRLFAMFVTLVIVFCWFVAVDRYRMQQRMLVLEMAAEGVVQRGWIHRLCEQDGYILPSAERVATGEICGNPYGSEDMSCRRPIEHTGWHQRRDGVWWQIITAHGNPDPPRGRRARWL